MTRKVFSIDPLTGKQTEVTVFTAREHVLNNAGYAYRPVLTGPNGYISDTLIQKPESVKLLTIRKRCDGAISAMKLVRGLSDIDIQIANLSDWDSATVLGMTLQAGQDKEFVDVLLFGNYEDPYFNFPVNAPLYLSGNGEISITPPEGHDTYQTYIGYGLGAGGIFLRPRNPIYLS
jgi:hypothetical protein